MKTRIIKQNDRRILEVQPGETAITVAEDALDLISECWASDAKDMVIYSTSVTPDFFDLRTGIAGEALQKFTQYGIRLAVVGDFINIESKSLRDFIRESNRGGKISFVGSIAEALEKLD